MVVKDSSEYSVRLCSHGARRRSPASTAALRCRSTERPTPQGSSVAGSKEELRADASASTTRIGERTSCTLADICVSFSGLRNCSLAARSTFSDLALFCCARSARSRGESRARRFAASASARRAVRNMQRHNVVCRAVAERPPVVECNIINAVDGFSGWRRVQGGDESASSAPKYAIGSGLGGNR